MGYKKILAVVCMICPFCILRRMFPASGYAKFMEKIEKACPFCIAYKQGKKGGKEEK